MLTRLNDLFQFVSKAISYSSFTIMFHVDVCDTLRTFFEKTCGEKLKN